MEEEGVGRIDLMIPWLIWWGGRRGGVRRRRLGRRRREEEKEERRVGLGAGTGATLKWMCGARGIGATHASVAPVASAPHIEPRKTAKSQTFRSPWMFSTENMI